MPEPTPIRHSFPKQLRLVRSVQFDEVFAFKASAADGRLVVYGKPNGLGHPRLGLVVSRKVGKAVQRNRWKRVLREAFRLAQHDLPPLDLICLPRMRDEPSYAPISQSLQRLAQRVDKKVGNRIRTASESEI